MSRRFPSPWPIRELEQAFRIEDANGQAVAYTYFRRSENTFRQAQVLTRDEARRIASNIVPDDVRAQPGLGRVYMRAAAGKKEGY